MIFGQEKFSWMHASVINDNEYEAFQRCQHNLYRKHK